MFHRWQGKSWIIYFGDNSSDNILHAQLSTRSQLNSERGVSEEDTTKKRYMSLFYTPLLALQGNENKDKRKCELPFLFIITLFFN